MAYYVDGVVAGSDTSLTGTWTSGDNCFVGARGDGGGGTTFNLDGNIDDLRIYQRDLSSSEVSDLYNGSTVSDAGLALSYNFDGNVIDQSGNGNDGTLVGNATYSAVPTLISWYDLDEASGNRLDSHINGYDLTDNNGVGTANGIAAGQATDGDPISVWYDKSGNSNDVTQTTAGTKPLLDIVGFNGLRTLDFDGSQYLQNLSYATSSSITVFVVADVNVVDATADSILSMNATNDICRAPAGALQISVGQSSEVIIYDKALTDEERIRVDTYLANRWGITI